MRSATFVFVPNLHIAELRVPELHWAVVIFMLGAEAPFAFASCFLEIFPTIYYAHGMDFWTIKNITVGDFCVFIFPFLVFYCPVTSLAKRNRALVGLLFIFGHTTSVCPFVVCWMPVPGVSSVFHFFIV